MCVLHSCLSGPLVISFGMHCQACAHCPTLSPCKPILPWEYQLPGQVMCTWLRRLKSSLRPSLVHGRCLVSWSSIAVGNIPCTDDFCCFSLDWLTPLACSVFPLSALLFYKSFLLGIRIRIRAAQSQDTDLHLLLAAPHRPDSSSAICCMYIQWHCAGITLPLHRSDKVSSDLPRTVWRGKNI